MKPHDGPIHEVTFSVDVGRRESLDEWLSHYVDEHRSLPGFLGVDTYILEDDAERAQRVVRFCLASAEHLDAYHEQHAASLASADLDSLGENLLESRRSLVPKSVGDPDPPAIQHCLNCDAELNGQYCWQCGQRSGRRLISLWELLRDAFGDLFELDSRLWRTLLPLIARPGLLTMDYLRGRRARYMPPFRMYIVLSLAFFVLAFFDPRDSLSILFPAQDAAETAAPATATDPAVDDDRLTLSVTVDETDNEALDCTLEGYDATQLPAWLARRLTRERLVEACQRFNADVHNEGRGILGKLADSVPVGLLVLLPVMALALKALYPLSRRYYVEHLLFVIHYHAFAFLVLTVLMLFGQLLAIARLPAALAEAASVGIGIYMPIYLYKSLRRVYGQGRWATLPKWLLLMMIYSIGLAVMLLIAAVFAAFST